MTQLLRWTEHRPLARVVDRYTSHISDGAVNFALQHDIDLIFVPTRATDDYQPLDRRVFGALKNIGQAICADLMFEEVISFTKAEAADIFMRSWRRLNKRTLSLIHI